MSFFEDDFYSTKPSKERQQRQWKQKDKRTARLSAADQKLLVMLTAGIGGVIGLVLLIWLVGLINVHPSNEAQAVTAVVPVSLESTLLTDNPFVGVADKIKPAVVSVITTAKGEGESGSSAGSGVIFQKNGSRILVLTNNHVVDGGTDFEIITGQGEHRKASLIGKDLITDLAVLEADGDGMKAVAEFGDSDSLRAGEFAIAVGIPLGLGYTPTVTLGMISLPSRTIPVSLGREGDYDWEMDVIQTDAAINQGNSGGPLVNIEGKVVGINSMKISDTGVEGLGFAIPINSVKPIIESLITNHKVKRPLLGVSTLELQSFKGTDVLKLPEDVKTGVIVFDVSGPAKEAGIKAEDVIVKLDDQDIPTTIALRKYLYNEKKIGDKIKVVFYRGSKKMDAVVTLVEAQ